MNLVLGLLMACSYNESGVDFNLNRVKINVAMGGVPLVGRINFSADSIRMSESGGQLTLLVDAADGAESVRVIGRAQRQPNGTYSGLMSIYFKGLSGEVDVEDAPLKCTAKSFGSR